MKEILLLGFYQPHEALSRFLVAAQQEFKIPIRWVPACPAPCHPPATFPLSAPSPRPPARRYLQEYAALGTAGGIYHFRDQILSGGTEAFFVLNADVCSEFPLQEMLGFGQRHGAAHGFVILGTTVSRERGWGRTALPWVQTPALSQPRPAGQQDAGAELRLHRGQR